MTSFHRPTQKWIDNSVTLVGLPHTYQPSYLRNFGHFSDSHVGWWRDLLLAQGAVKSDKTLTHLAWWREELVRGLSANMAVPHEKDK